MSTALLLVQLVQRLEASLTPLLRRAGPALLVFTWALLLGVPLLFFDLLLGKAYLPLPHLAGHLLLSAALLGNVFLHLWRAAHTSPGFTHDLPTEGFRPGWRWCRRCQLAKPPLAHHCSLCGKCVLKMDHHCPWLNNCVGFYNYHSYFLLLVYVMLSCVYLAPWFWWATRGGPRTRPLSFFNHSSPELLAQPLLPGLGLAVSTAGGLGCTALLGWHLYLVFTGQTTLEFYANQGRARVCRQQGQRWVNEYDLGWRQNFKECFGVEGRWWWVAWLLPRAAPPRGSGASFPTIYDVSGAAAVGAPAALGGLAASCVETGGSPFSPKWGSSPPKTCFQLGAAVA